MTKIDEQKIDFQRCQWIGSLSTVEISLDKQTSDCHAIQLKEMFNNRGINRIRQRHLSIVFQQLDRCDRSSKNVRISPSVICKRIDFVCSFHTSSNIISQHSEREERKNLLVYFSLKIIFDIYRMFSWEAEKIDGFRRRIDLSYRLGRPQAVRFSISTLEYALETSGERSFRIIRLASLK